MQTFRRLLASLPAWGLTKLGYEEMNCLDT